MDHHKALIYTMVLVSASDGEMNDVEIGSITEHVRYMPVFRDFDTSRIPEITDSCLRVLADEDGLDKALDLIRAELPEGLRETAYLVACDVAAADGRTAQEELRLLEMLRHRLDLSRLVCAAIERATRARHVRG